MLAAETVGESTSKVVGQCLGDAEDDDERQDRGACHNVKLLLGDSGQDAAFQADHPADEGIDQHQQRELSEVFA